MMSNPDIMMRNSDADPSSVQQAEIERYIPRCRPSEIIHSTPSEPYESVRWCMTSAYLYRTLRRVIGIGYGYSSQFIAGGSLLRG